LFAGLAQRVSKRIVGMVFSYLLWENAAAEKKDQQSCWHQRVSKRTVGQVFSFYGKMLRLKGSFSSLVGKLSPKSIKADCRTGLFIFVMEKCCG
jgi:hypothetical protein